MDKKTLNIIGTVLFLTAFAAIALFSLPRVLGVSMYCIMSESMEPKIHKGSLAYAMPADLYKLTEEDIVVYKVNGEPLTRRIVSIDSISGKVTLKSGRDPDGNEVTVASEDIQGKIAFSLPFVGRLGLFANQLAGKVVFLGMMFAGARLIFYTDDRDEMKRSKPPEGKKIFTAPEDWNP